MKIYVAKTLVEDVNFNTCSVHLCHTLEECREWAEEEIKEYAADYRTDYQRTNTGFSMQSGDAYVTIELEIHDF